jgi:hypothetical protein
VQRVGQDLFRDGLLDYWDGICAVTGLAVPELLRASHIKPWVDCDTDAERLDLFNGLLLAPKLDAAMDRGFITIDDAAWSLSRTPSTLHRGRSWCSTDRFGSIGSSIRIARFWHGVSGVAPRARLSRHTACCDHRLERHRPPAQTKTA